MAQNEYRQPPFQSPEYRPSFRGQSKHYGANEYFDHEAQSPFRQEPAPYEQSTPGDIEPKYKSEVTVNTLESIPIGSFHGQRNSYFQLSQNTHDKVPPSPTNSTFKYHLDHAGVKLESTFRQYFLTWVLALFTLGWMIFTIYFAYNCSISNPLTPSLIFSKPERTILLLNILSQFTIFLLAELTLSVFEALRWAFASSPHGINAFSFVGLSRATSLLGILSLLIRGRIRGPGEPILSKDGHRLWGLQRVFFTLVRGALGVVLLSNISFNSAYHGVSLFPVTAGLSPINASIADQSTSNLAAVTFASYYRSILLDNTHVIRIPPLSCSGDDCFSYFFPGGLDSIFPRPSSYQQFPEATAYIVNDAPGYQIEFYPISSSDPQLLTGDCQVFGTPFSALQVCVKKVDSNLIAGWNACPPALGSFKVAACLNETSWRTNITYATKMTITKRRATTAFDRGNATILDIIDLPDYKEPTNYGPEDFFGIFSRTFFIDNDDINNIKTIEFQFLNVLTSFLSIIGTEDQINEEAFHGLRSLMAVPVMLYNNAVLGDGPTPTDLGKSATVAIPSYRIIIGSYSLYTFLVGGIISLVWSLIMLAICMRVQVPNSSLYPEIDFATKCIDLNTSNRMSQIGKQRSTTTIARLMYPLSNANSRDIEKRIAASRFYVGVTGNQTKEDAAGHVAISLEDGLGSLVTGQKYS